MAAYEQRSYPGAAADTLLSADLTAGGLSFAVTAGTGGGYPDGSAGPFWVIIDYDNSKAEKIRVTGRVNDTFTVPASDGRGNDGTVGQAHSTGAKVRAVIAATDIQEANRAAVNTVGRISAKGDLLAGSGANTTVKVTVGADGTVLSADSTQTGGVRWYTIPADAVAATAALRTLGTGAQQAAAGNHGHSTLASPTITTPTIVGSGGTLTLPAGPDTLVGRATTDTLTNKTLNNPALVNPTLTGAVGTLSLPAGPETLVGRATTDTLTNKTLVGAALDSTSVIGGVSGITIAGDHAAWIAYTPSFINITGAAGTFRYLLVGKTLYFRGYFSGGSVTATNPIGFSLPVTSHGSGGQVAVSNSGVTGSWDIPANTASASSHLSVNSTTSLAGVAVNGVIETV